MQCKFSFYYKGLNNRTHYPSTHLLLAGYGAAGDGEATKPHSTSRGRSAGTASTTSCIACAS
jgi:hypothetical protein